MSYKNRKMMYDKLVAEAKGFKAEEDPFFKISQALRDEFGEPSLEEPKEEVVEEEEAEGPAAEEVEEAADPEAEEVAEEPAEEVAA